jgi:hypothetical protein
MSAEPLSTAEALQRIAELEKVFAERRDSDHRLNTVVSELLSDVQVAVDNHEKTLSGLTPALTAMTADLREIKTALIGDSYGNRGVLGREQDSKVERAELRKMVESHERKLWTWGGGLSALLLGFEFVKDRLFK